MKKKYIYPELSERAIILSEIIALSTSEDDDERAPQSVKERDELFEEDLWDTSTKNSLW